MENIQVLTEDTIEKIYTRIIEEMSLSQFKDMRTKEYWRERDSMQHHIQKKKVTIEFYIKYKDRLRKNKN